MTPEERRRLLQDLHSGRTSRNREVDRFAAPSWRRVLTGYRRVKALLRDLERPGVAARGRWEGNPGHLAVALEDVRLRYRRVVLLTPWELEFLESVGGPSWTRQLGVPRPT